MITREEKRNIVVEELEKIPPPKKVGDKNILIRCPWHKERHPSCSVNIDNPKVPVGTFHCFGCGKSGNWNILAKKIGLKELSETESIDSESLGKLIRDKIAESEGNPPEITNIASLSGWNKSWKRKRIIYPKEFLRQFGAMSYYDEKSGMERILFPIKMFGETVGYVIEGNGDGYHRFSKGKWVKKAMFPYDLHNDKSVVLVEGISDALNLIKHNIPAMSFFGVNNWDKYKSNLLAAKGIEIVCIVCDGDLAGYECNRRIWKELRDEFDTRILDLPRLPKGKMDPETAPPKILRVIKNMCKP